MTEYIIHRIILLLKAKTFQFHGGAFYTMHLIAVKTKASKNADFMAEHIIYCIILLLKPKKNSTFMVEHLIHRILLLLKVSKTSDFTTEHIIHLIVLLLKVKIFLISWRSIFYAMHRFAIINASKNTDFTTEHFLHCDLKQSKFRFHNRAYFFIA